MRFIQSIMGLLKKNEERNDTCDDLISRIETALLDAESMFSNQREFLDPQEETRWKNKHSAILADSECLNIQRLKKAFQFKFLYDKRLKLLETANSMSHRILQHNQQVASTKLHSAYALIGDVEGRKLDRQQMTCIVKEAHNHLVIAGAGTGKTTTIVGKVKYLIKIGKCLPQDILVLSFTNASASEMSARIFSETGQDITATTFHKFALNIISQVQGVAPKITQINLRKFIKEQILLNMKFDAYLRQLNQYLLYHRVPAKSEFEFKSRKEYDEYLKLNPPTTVKNETVKSYGEMDIANFLTQNNIPYIYEHPYEIDTRTNEYGQYYPDFYLPDYKIYIEYFGINRRGEVPPYFKAAKGMSAAEAYCTSMRWKRKIHLQHQTTMIECYAYEKLEGNLLESLKEKLEAQSVILSPKNSNELWSQIADGGSLLEGIVELFETLINLIKGNGYDIATVQTINQSGKNIYENNILLRLLEPIFNAYSHHLLKHNEIDFNDMIKLASEYIKQAKYINPYKYVIVDEYQDISKARFTLLNCLRMSRDYELFCVGDDWQSIYRFAGSDIGFILNFSAYWGATEISRIETTYRFPQKLIEISGNFIMQNPAQIRKNINGRHETFGFPLGEIFGYTEKFAIQFMSNKLNDLPKHSSVIFIGRYSFDVKMLDDSSLFTCQYNNTSGLIDVKTKFRPDLNMVFMTAHKSKGLQADYVFIINNKSSRTGFPSKIHDSPILNLLLDNSDRYPHAEERRLFYVAMTRAKKKVFIVTVKGQESEFISELKGKYGSELKKEQFECPLCAGQLVKRSGPHGEFFGCSNFHSSGCTYKRKIR